MSHSLKLSANLTRNSESELVDILRRLELESSLNDSNWKKISRFCVFPSRCNPLFPRVTPLVFRGCLVDCLAPGTGKDGWSIKDSPEFVNLLWDHKFRKNNSIQPFDVVSLLTNILTELVVEEARSKLEEECTLDFVHPWLLTVLSGCRG